MKQIWTITKKELRSFFDSLMAYILLVLFLGFTGFFTWVSGGSDIFTIEQATMKPFFGIAQLTLFFVIPALTMRQIAEENNSGTIELLLTKPLNIMQLIMGKFMATLLLVVLALSLTLPYYITLANIGTIDHNSVWLGYFGLIALSATYISIGLFASSLTNNQIVALLIALLIGVILQFIFGILAASSSGVWAQILSYLSAGRHYDAISRGVLDSRDLLYFGSVVVMALLGAEAMLAKKTS